VPGFTYAEFNNLDSWKAAITEDTIALMVELVQGEGGVIPADPAFVQGLVDLCREKDLLLIVDEVQTGFGRTGRMFAYEQFGIRPDVITVAKSLGGGVPLGALLVNARANVFEPGDHSTTVGGGGIALAAAKASMQLMQAPGLMEEVQRKGELIQGEWRKWSQDLKAVSGGRGMGLMLALLLNVPAKQVMLECLEEGLIVNAVADQTIRILPALNIPDEDLIAGLAILHRVLQRYQ
jgi:acetylornithine/N-succinyldiaminopimelate aminotransferase